ncbi:MAG: acetate kinase, partial [Candidatus Thermofonsia bacterium]
MNNRILVINCGSSSLKFALMEPKHGRNLINGIAERLGTAEAQLVWRREGDKNIQPIPQAKYKEAMQAIIDVMSAQELLAEPLAAVGHRVVHGGEAFTASTIIQADVLAAIEACNHLAPLHNPANVIGIRTAMALFPNVPQVAVFDTAFHQTLPPHAYLYPVPYDLYLEQGVRRYGFHGTSHRYVTEQAAERLQRPYHSSRFLSAHLGNGCSAAAVANGQSV